MLAPLVGEYLLGNQPITALPAVLMLAPMYGCGALLIRGGARRAGCGWPTMLLLAAAYALLEEGPIDQMRPASGGCAPAGHAVPDGARTTGWPWPPAPC
ncbi:hypothetical protein ACO0M4_13355 [Streptomyces sp. RGM 3693]|uniref:hypothetical protein n=1 Tax=Streptomyces sp. RGM 3693 TaxID=3413284 RepID=UPI003D2E29CE